MSTVAMLTGAALLLFVCATLPAAGYRHNTIPYFPLVTARRVICKPKPLTVVVKALAQSATDALLNECGIKGWYAGHFCARKYYLVMTHVGGVCKRTAHKYDNYRMVVDIAESTCYNDKESAAPPAPPAAEEICVPRPHGRKLKCTLDAIKAGRPTPTGRPSPIVWSKSAGVAAPAAEWNRFQLRHCKVAGEPESKPTPMATPRPTRPPPPPPRRQGFMFVGMAYPVKGAAAAHLWSKLPALSRWAPRPRVHRRYG